MLETDMAEVYSMCLSLWNEKFLLEILLPNSKPVIAGFIYHFRSQNDILKLLNSNMNKNNSVDNEIYIIGNFSIN